MSVCGLCVQVPPEARVRHTDCLQQEFWMAVLPDMGVWEMNLGLLQEQQVLLNTEPALQHTHTFQDSSSG